MGILDSFEKVVNTASRATGTAQRGANTISTAKNLADKAGKVLEKKCKECGSPLKSDIEKQKGICANCALKRM